MAVEARPWVADAVVDVPTRLDLEPRQKPERLAIDGDRVRAKRRALAPPSQEVEQRRVAEVLLEIHPDPGVLAVDLGNGKPGGPEGSGEGQEGPVLKRIRVVHADRRPRASVDPEQTTARPVSVKRRDPVGIDAKAAPVQIAKRCLHG